MTKQVVVDESVPSTENGNENDENQSIWASILRDVKSSTKKAPATKSLVVLGDNESGRTTLVAKLQGTDDPKRGAGLEYHYIDIKDDDRDDTPKLGVWILDGDVACSAPLLKFAIKSENLENTILILVATMTQPWSLLSTLKKWITLVEEHIDKLQIDPTRLREMRDHLQYDFQHYIEPNDSSIMLTSSASSITIKSGVGGRVPSSASSISLASTTPLSPTNGDEQVVLPLPDGVLTKSLGIPVIVVITKCDSMPTLEKENDYKDEYFDFMQHHLRRFCLEYGAALFYTSVKEKKNIDKLYKYIVHKCYGYPFISPAAIVERDAIFIPIGWDNPKKVDILLENLHRLKSTDNYSDVFVKPIVRRPLQRDNEIITAEDDQEFLARLQLTLNRAASPGRTDENATPVLTRTSGVSGGVGSQTPSVAGRPRNQPNAATGGATTAANEGALANFFNSLLTRKSGGAVTPTSASTPSTQRQTSQSPTTPSSKRLQQHPLTFAVTPPPGRQRTPTSHKTFPSSLNVESPPKLLSPVVEQQSKVETTSSTSLTIVRTPIEDGEPVKISDITENEQSPIKNVEPLQLNRNEEDFNDALQHEKEPITNRDQQNIESIPSEYTPVPNTIDNSDVENLNSTSQSSSLIENKSNIVQDTLTNDTHRRLSNDFSVSQNLTQEQGSEIPRSPSNHSPITEIPENNEHTNNNASPTIRSRSISPSPADEFSNTENQNDVSTTNQSASSSPSINNNNKVFDRSPSIDHKSPRLSSSPTFETTQQLNDEDDSEQQLVTQEEAPKSSVEDISSNTNNDQQQDDLKQSLPSSRRNSTMNSSISPRTSSPISNEPQQQEDKTLSTSGDIIQTLTHDNVTDFHSENDLSNEVSGSEPLNRRSSSSDVQEPQSPIQSRPTSPTAIELPKLPSIDHAQNHTLSFHTEEKENSSIPTGVLDEDSLAIHSPKRLSMSNLDTSEQDHHDKILNSFSDANNNRNYLHSPVDMLNEHPILDSPKEIASSPAIENDKLLEPPVSEHPASSSTIDAQEDTLFIEDNQQKSPTRERNISSSSIPPNLEATKLIESPTFDSVDKKPGFDEETTSLSPTHEENQRSRSPSPINKDQQRSRSPSPIPHEEQQRSRSPSSFREQAQQRSRSPSTITHEKEQRSRSPSPTIEQEQERSQSESPIDQKEQKRSRSPSPTIEEKQERTQSASPVAEQGQEQSRSSSPIIHEEKQTSRSPSPTIQEDQERNSLESPTAKQEQERSRSPSPIAKKEPHRSRSASPTFKQEQERSRSPSPIIHEEQQKSRAPSPTVGQELERSRPVSPVAEQGQERNQSPSLMTQGKEQRSRSPSPIAKEKQHRSPSPSIIANREQKRSRSPSPITQEETQRSRSPSLIVKQEQERSRSPSPIVQEKEQRSRSPSPVAKEEQYRSRSPSPNFEQERSRSPLLIVKQEQERSRSPSPIIQEKVQRSRSPSPTFKQEQERSRSPSPIIQEDQQTSGSPSLIVKQEQDRSRSPSPIIQEKEQRSRSPSQIVKQEKERSRSPSPSTEQEKERSRPVSPVAERDQARSRSPPLTSQQEQERSRSPSSITQEEQQRSRSPSRIVKQEQERSRSPSPVAMKEQKRSRSPSPTFKQEQERSRSPSPIIHEMPQRSGSSSLIAKQENERSQSPSLTIEQEKERSRPISPVAERDQTRSRSPSPTFKQEQERSRSPSSITQEEQQRSRSPSLIVKEEQERSRSPSPIIQEKEQRSRSPSPIIYDEQQRSRSPSLIVKQETERSRYPSPTIEQKQEHSRSVSPVAERDQVRNRSPSLTIQVEQQKSRSPSLIVKQEQERSRSPSPIIEKEREQSRPMSPVAEQNHQRSRSPLPTIEANKERSRSPSPKVEQEQEENRSSSPIEEKEERSSYLKSSSFDEQKERRSRSPSPSMERNQQISRTLSLTHEDQRKNSFSNESLENKLDSTENEVFLPRAFSNHENETQSAGKVDSSPVIDNQQSRHLDTSTSQIDDNQQRYSSSQIDENKFNSTSPKGLISPVALTPKSEESKSPRIGRHFDYEATHNLRENTAGSPRIDSEQQSHNRSSSPTHNEEHNHHNEKKNVSLTPLSPKMDNELFGKEEYKSEEVNKNEQLKSSPLAEKSSRDRQEISFTEKKILPVASPLSTTLKNNQSSQALESPVNESIPSTTLEKQGTTSPVSAIDQDQTNLSHSSPQLPSVDHDHEFNLSAIPIPPVVRHPSISRSNSQSAVARPNTLRFSPNNHDLDGLYMSSDYNDEDEVPEDNEYHPNSAPSTVTVEHRRSSLLRDNTIEQKDTPIDTNNISKRLSTVEKLRMEDNDNNVVDSTNSKDT